MTFKVLEDRRLLSVAAGDPAVRQFDASPALFAANQGQIADAAVRYAFFGSGANVLLTDAGVTFQVSAGGRRVGGECLRGRRSLGGDRLAGPVRAGFSVRVEGPRTALFPSARTRRARSTITLSATVRNGPSRACRRIEKRPIRAFTGRRSGHLGPARTVLKSRIPRRRGHDYGRSRIRYDGIKGLSLDAQGVLHVRTALAK